MTEEQVAGLILELSAELIESGYQHHAETIIEAYHHQDQEEADNDGL